MVGNIMDACFGIAVENRRLDDARNMAIELLRNGYDELEPDRMKRVLAIIADMMDPDTKTETNIKFEGAKHRPAPFGGDTFECARDVWGLIGAENTMTAKQVVPPPPIDEQTAIGIVAEKRGIKPDTVRRHYNRHKATLEEVERIEAEIMREEQERRTG